MIFLMIILRLNLFIFVVNLQVLIKKYFPQKNSMLNSQPTQSTAQSTAQSTSTSRSPVLWSARLRHPSLSLTTTKCTFSGSSIPLSVCTFASLSADISTGRHTWTFTIEKLSRVIALGMVSLSRALQNCMLAGSWFTERDNGVYCVVTDGRVYVETNYQLQTQYTNWKLTSGDALEVCYDATENTIEFANKGEKVRAEVRRPDEGDRYVPCIYLCPDVGAMVEVGMMKSETVSE